MNLLLSNIRALVMLLTLAGQRILAFEPLLARRGLVQRIATSTALSSKTPATTFDNGDRPFAITTPIYYVNDKPHIGHAYTSTGT